MDHRDDDDAPRIVRYGSSAAVLAYAHSLCTAFFTLWVLSVLGHALSGRPRIQLGAAGSRAEGTNVWDYFSTSQ